MHIFGKEDEYKPFSVACYDPHNCILKKEMEKSEEAKMKKVEASLGRGVITLKHSSKGLKLNTWKIKPGGVVRECLLQRTSDGSV